METKVQQVIWSETATKALESVYAFYLTRSEIAALSIVHEIIEKAESIVFPEQYQKDETVIGCRRMFVRDYKILYQAEGLTIHIVHILCTKKPTL